MAVAAARNDLVAAGGKRAVKAMQMCCTWRVCSAEGGGLRGEG